MKMIFNSILFRTATRMIAALGMVALLIVAINVRTNNENRRIEERANRLVVQLIEEAEVTWYEDDAFLRIGDRVIKYTTDK